VQGSAAKLPLLAWVTAVRVRTLFETVFWLENGRQRSSLARPNRQAAIGRHIKINQIV